MLYLCISVCVFVCIYIPKINDLETKTFGFPLFPMPCDYMHIQCKYIINIHMCVSFILCRTHGKGNLISDLTF